MDIASGVEIVAADDVWSLAKWRNLLVVSWRKTPSPERAGQVQAQLEAMAAAPGRPMLHMVTVVEAGAGAPDGATRAVIKQGLRALEGRIGSAAAVVFVEGFMGAAVRASLSAMIVLQRERYPVRVFSEADEVAAWVAARMGDVSEADVAAALAGARGA